MFLCIIFLVLIVCQDLVLTWSLCQLLFSVVCERVGHALRTIFMLWSVKIWQVSLCGKFMKHLETCLLSQLKLTEFCVNLWCFNCLFPLDVRNEIQLLSRVFCCSWLLCLLGFWLKLVYFDSSSWQSFVSTCDVFNCFFPLDLRNEIQLPSRVFCCSWLLCLLGFWLRNTSLIVMYQEFVVCNVAGNCINERGELNNILLQVGKHMARRTYCACASA